MPILTILSLLVAVIKVGIEVSAWLRAHPDIAGKAQASLNAIHTTLTEIHQDIEDIREAHSRVEAP